MTRRRIEVNCVYISGVPGLTAKIATADTVAFVAHMRSYYHGSFTIVYSAGVDAGWTYDSCSGAGKDFEAAVVAFAPSP